ncbi:hypothetical protein HEB94_002549 [Actinopolymorpha pittospori]|uniref:Uncharacterized protein n=1 Tax=Actinopolymorpha pittospori TaxID=648752 RepID=A0A927RI07_9ACTN|nr:hypothetical protein [Actinopolymorpha pittospori]
MSCELYRPHMLLVLLTIVLIGVAYQQQAGD